MILYEFLTEEQKEIAESNKITQSIYDKRIKQRWNFEYAYKLNKSFRKHGDEYFMFITVLGKQYKVSAQDQFILDKNGVSRSMLIQRIRTGYSYDLAVRLKLNESEEDYYERIFIEKWEEKERAKEEHKKKTMQRQKIKSIPKSQYFNHLEYTLLRNFKEA
ncbi:hypothetical protein [Staphylococcus felis]|uniref:hypothetical protein n=1 Tax=Staphylococcus felis TaxID=46127 RepID=UPI0039679ACF